VLLIDIKVMRFHLVTNSVSRRVSTASANCGEK
jgi:hypothetical protein